MRTAERSLDSPVIAFLPPESKLIVARSLDARLAGDDLRVTMMDERSQPTRVIVVVDDDPAVRDSTVNLLEQAGHKVHPFETGEALIEAGVPEDADIILLDVLMPGLSGLETLRILSQKSDLPPIVMMTGHGDIPLAVEAIKLGAAEFLEKPYPMHLLLDLVSSLEREARAEGETDPRTSDAKAKVQRLSPRQREVLKGIACGEPSKVTAHRLGLSVRTVEAYRGHLFNRLGVRGMAEAVRIAVQAGLLDSRHEQE